MEKDKDFQHNRFLKIFPNSVIQFLPDNKKDKKLTIPKPQKELDLVLAESYQSKGYGIFFSLNGFENESRTKEKLTNINGLTIDLDISKEKDQVNDEIKLERKEHAMQQLKNYKFPPHLVIETKNGLQAIWLLKEKYDSTHIIFAEKVQHFLIEVFQADLGAKDVTRLIRFPQFFHLKDINTPFLCNIKYGNFELPKYELETLNEFYTNEFYPQDTSENFHELNEIPVKEVLEKLSNEVGITISFDENPNKSLQIIENGERTSGFISARGNFVYSSSGKERKGNAFSLAKYYLQKDSEAIFNWLRNNFPLKDKGALTDIEEDFYDFNPSLHFDNTRAYINVTLRERDGNKGLQERSYLITSKKEKFILGKEFFENNGFFTNKTPTVRYRWSKKSQNEYLDKSNTNNNSLTIVDDIKEVLHEYIELSDQSQYDIITLWIIGTYFHQMFNAIPYLSITGNPGCGKTKLLELISLLAFNGELLNSNSTRAAIKSLINDDAATCCVDEVETLMNSKEGDSKEILSMYNGGYKKGQYIYSSVLQGKNWIAKRYDSFSPKAFAGINSLALTLESRCISVVMIRSANNEVKNSEIDRTNSIWQDIRDKLYLLTMNYWEDVKVSYKDIKDREIEGREWELWKPILVLAEVFHPSVKVSLKEYAVANSEERTELHEDQLVTPILLKSINQFFLGLTPQVDEKKLTIKEIEEILISNGYYLENFFDITNIGRQIGKELKKAGIINHRSSTERRGDKTMRVYTLKWDTIQNHLKAYS